MLKSVLGLSPVAAGLFVACFMVGCSDGGTKCDDGETCDGSGAGLDGADAGNKDAGKKDAAAGKDAKASTSPDAGAPLAKKFLPCDVQPIVKDKCSLCHGVEPSAGAPMSLVTALDFQATAADKRAMYANVKDKLNQTTPSLKMPPTTSAQLSEAELGTMMTWLNAGAPGVDKACSTSGDTTPDAGVVDAGPLPWTEPTDDQLTCYKITAHNGDFKTPYKVGVAKDSYVAFTFVAPWPETAYGIVINSVIDNKKALHHWLLFQDLVPGAGGAIVPEIGAHPSGQLLAAWAPGADPMDFRKLGQGVGLELPGGSNNTYTLELHYNSSDAAAVDASGVEVCVVSDRKPANIAAYSWLGNDNLGFPSTHWQGTCAPTAQTEPIHIVSFMPHMHLTGVHMKGTINRKDGTKEVVHDQPFDFNYQKSYPVDLVLNPGDTLTTDCDYSQPQVFGQPTDKEMCYLFSMAYPKGALASIDVWGGIAHGASSCLGN
ncbi:MAG: hypothetical protein JWN48_4402 [Myxococcaceae bacterium]|nr:hypothetical protein [Myxococcaceae bacterium]